MAEAAKNPIGGHGPAGQPAPADPGSAQSPQASLSQRAEELAARLEEHKHKAQAASATTKEANRKEAIRRAMSGKPETASKTAAQPEAKTEPAKDTQGAAKPAAARPATAKPAAKVPAAAAKEPKQAEPKANAAAKTAAGSKPAAKNQAKDPVEDVIRAIKLPHEIEAEQQATHETKQSPATTVQPKLENKAATTAQNVPPVSVAPQPGASPTTEAAVAQARTRVFGNYAAGEESSEAAVKRRVARERALNSKPALGRTAQVIVAAAFPLLALIAAIRLIATPAFLALSYARPGFPSDAFGFSDAERLTYGSYGVDYLNNFAGRDYLAGLKLPTGSSMFTDAEVQHMVDVKNLIGVAYVLGAVLAVIMIIGLWYLAKRYAGGVRRALFSGAILTLVLIAALAVLAILGWDMFFTQFHALFFSEGTWTFKVSDTLIRLYPEQFWMDSAIGIALLVIATVLVVLISCWPTGRRRESARLRQEARAFGIGN